MAAADQSELPECFKVKERSKYEKVSFNVDISHLSEAEQTALKLLAQACVVIDNIFLLQKNKKNGEYLEMINSFQDDEMRTRCAEYYDMMMGIQENGLANFYPEDMTVTLSCKVFFCFPIKKQKKFASLKVLKFIKKKKTTFFLFKFPPCFS